MFYCKDLANWNFILLLRQRQTTDRTIAFDADVKIYARTILPSATISAALDWIMIDFTFGDFCGCDFELLDHFEIDLKPYY